MIQQESLSPFTGITNDIKKFFEENFGKEYPERIYATFISGSFPAEKVAEYASQVVDNSLYENDGDDFTVSSFIIEPGRPNENSFVAYLDSLGVRVVPIQVIKRRIEHWMSQEQKTLARQNKGKTYAEAVIPNVAGILAFWDGKSYGTQQAIEFALKNEKPVLIIYPDGSTEVRERHAIDTPDSFLRSGLQFAPDTRSFKKLRKAVKRQKRVARNAVLENHINDSAQDELSL